MDKDNEPKKKSIDQQKKEYLAQMNQDREESTQDKKMEDAEQEGKDIYSGSITSDALNKESVTEEPEEEDKEPVSHDNIVSLHQVQERLTPKQESFVRHILKGDDLSTAYRKSYDASKMSPASINREAHRLSNNHKITPRIKRGMEVREVSAQTSYHSLRHSVIERLDQMANDRDASDSARVRSLEMLGKHVGLFTEQVNITNDKSSLELQEELTIKIAELLEMDQESG